MKVEVKENAKATSLKVCVFLLFSDPILLQPFPKRYVEKSVPFADPNSALDMSNGDVRALAQLLNTTFGLFLSGQGRGYAEEEEEEEDDDEEHDE